MNIKKVPNSHSVSAATSRDEKQRLCQAQPLCAFLGAKRGEVCDVAHISQRYVHIYFCIASDVKKENNVGEIFMLKRGLSVFLASALLILCFFSVPAFAAEPEFDISDYTIEDLETMTTAEKKKLMEDFIEVYNPYGLRDLIEQESSASGGFGVRPYWKSDGDSSTPIEQEMATHQLVTLEAMMLFMLDYGFYDTDAANQLILALYIAAASALPDKQEKDALTFSGHFHDPDTDQNFLGKAWPTAATRASTHYHIAYTHLNENVNMDITSDEFMTVLERLGKCLHYVQDACEPHHASNVIAGLSSHSDFEAYVETNIDACLQDISVPTEFYVQNRTISVFAITDDAAKQAKPLFEAVANKKDQSQWSSVGKICIRNSVQYSASVIYKLFYECNAPFI